MTSPAFSYCEASTASGSTPWHIRRLTEAGRKLGGGIDTPSLCERVKPPYGWDLQRGPDELMYSARPKYVCAKCFGIWFEEGRPGR